MATEISKSTSLILPREISAQNNVSNEHAVTRAVKVSTTRAKDRRRERINVLKQKGSQPKPFFQAQPARHPSSDPGSSLAKRNEPDEWNSFSSATIDVETIPVHERESMLADSAGLLKSGRDRLLAEETVSGIHAKKTSMKEEELEAAGYATTDQKDSLDKFFTWQQLNDSTPFEASTEVSTKVSPEVASSTNKDKPLRHSEQQHAQQGQRDLGQEVHALETAVNRQQRRRQRDRQSHRATLAAETLPPPQPLLSTPPPPPLAPASPPAAAAPPPPFLQEGFPHSSNSPSSSLSMHSSSSSSTLSMHNNNNNNDNNDNSTRSMHSNHSSSHSSRTHNSRSRSSSNPTKVASVRCLGARLLLLVHLARPPHLVA
mmetsp:Transcript_68597/g.134700  ORF Transcript_68597/g.134700 Transcript_68597/m.134700 type:complete len:373 (+) Transcript_68597:179-1297(+)